MVWSRHGSRPSEAAELTYLYRILGALFSSAADIVSGAYAIPSRPASVRPRPSVRQLFLRIATPPTVFIGS